MNELDLALLRWAIQRNKRIIIEWFRTDFTDYSQKPIESQSTKPNRYEF